SILKLSNTTVHTRITVQSFEFQGKRSPLCSTVA
ncbi:unnamed protein product, partial [Allacma fusca]